MMKKRKNKNNDNKNKNKESKSKVSISRLASILSHKTNPRNIFIPYCMITPLPCSTLPPMPTPCWRPLTHQP